MGFRVASGSGALTAPLSMPVVNGGAGATVFCWMRNTSGASSPRAGLGQSATTFPRLAVNLNTGSFRGIWDHSGGAGLTPTTAAASQTWLPIAFSVINIGGTAQRRAVANQVLLTASAVAADVRGFTRVTVGSDPGTTAADNTGDFAHFGVWDQALSDAEMVALNSGVSPLRIRPGALRGYWPLDRDGRNLAGSQWLISMGATGDVRWTDNPVGVETPISPERIYYFLAAATGGTEYPASAAATISAAAAANGLRSRGVSAAASVSLSATVTGRRSRGAAAAATISVTSAASSARLRTRTASSAFNITSQATAGALRGVSAGAAFSFSATAIGVGDGDLADLPPAWVNAASSRLRQSLTVSRQRTLNAYSV